MGKSWDVKLRQKSGEAGSEDEGKDKSAGNLPDLCSPGKKELG